MDLTGKKILSIGILYNADKACNVANAGDTFPFSQLITVFFDTCILAATSSCVIPAFTRAAANEICHLSSFNVTAPFIFSLFEYYHHFKCVSILKVKCFYFYY